MSIVWFKWTRKCSTDWATDLRNKQISYQQASTSDHSFFISALHGPLPSKAETGELNHNTHSLYWTYWSIMHIQWFLYYCVHDRNDSQSTGPCFFLRWADDVCFSKPGCVKTDIKKTVFLLTEEVTNNKVHVHWCCLNGVLKMNPVDSAAIPRPPSAKARQNGTTEGIHDYFIVFTGFHLQLQVLKDWIKSCCKPVCFMGKCSL